MNEIVNTDYANWLQSISKHSDDDVSNLKVQQVAEHFVAVHLHLLVREYV